MFNSEDQLSKRCEQSADSPLTLGLSPETLTQLVNAQLQRATAEVTRLTELKALLEANPETERILQLMGQRLY